MASLQRSLASSMAADSSFMNAFSVVFDTNWKQMSLITKKKRKEKKKQQTKSFQNSLGGRSLFLFLFFKLVGGLLIQRVHLS